MAPVSRRSVPRGLLAASVGGVAASALTGLATTGGSSTTFFSAQLPPAPQGTAEGAGMTATKPVSAPVAERVLPQLLLLEIR